MLQCPHCANRTFTAGITISARVHITGLDNGDYQEEERDSYNREWHNLQCLGCERYVEEEDAQEAFDNTRPEEE